MNHLAKSSKMAAATAIALSVACAPVEQKPLASDKARITLSSDVGNDVRAYRADGELTHSIRFDDLSPGPHELQVRYHFEVPGGASTGALLGGNFRTCVLEVSYDGFSAGEHYVLETVRRGWRSGGGLYQQPSGDKVANAHQIRCEPGL